MRSNPLIAVLDLALWLLLQMPLAFLCWLADGWAFLVKQGYVAVMKLRRVIKGTPAFQAHDVMLGIPDPQKAEEWYQAYQEGWRLMANHARGCNVCWSYWAVPPLRAAPPPLPLEPPPNPCAEGRAITEELKRISAEMPRCRLS